MSGFKSFVDATTIYTPSHLIAVVGPNGCGKSNIIDAITWVMGESSPKYLRGEALTDVIFNGSTSRKPVGQASVELVFDNADGSLGGEYAKYSEISIKRLITRDSDSTYYLNGVRCRKRDVVHLFLGTGLGPRSYSIIGQNMISRMIEAKPEELRTYLEEAAGISKYKDRRRETELRMQHTRENLARVSDLRGELEKQLSHLKHQANLAEKFKTLKQQERIFRAELYGLEWRVLDSKMVGHSLQIQHEETALEARNSEQSRTGREIEQLRHEQRVAQDAHQEIQRRYYAVGNEITRIEQDILHHQERQQQWESDLQQAENDWQTVKNQMSETEDNLHELEHETQHIEPALSAINHDIQSAVSDLADAEEKVQDWQNRWDAFNEVSAKSAQTAQVEKTHIQHLEQSIASLQKREKQLLEDEKKFNFSSLDKEIETFAKEAAETKEKLKTFEGELADIRKESQALQLKQQASTVCLDEARSELQRLRGQQASLEALQQTALGQRNNPTAAWVVKHELQTKPRLGQSIQVENGWELAAEKVLGFCLQAVCVDEASEIIPYLEDFKTGNLCVFTAVDASAIHHTSDKTKGALLLDKIKSPWPLASFISGVYVADSLKEALALCASLDINESVVTRDGIWLNRSWFKVLREDDPAAGVFQREQELKQLTLRVTELQELQDKYDKEINVLRESATGLDQKREQLQKAYNKQQMESAQVNAQYKTKKERLAELKTQSERFKNELVECTQQLKQAETEYEQSRSLWDKALHDLEHHATARQELLNERDKAKQHLQVLRQTTNEKKEKMHELEIRLETSKSQKNALQQTYVHMQAQMSSLSDRKITLQSELSSMQPMEVLKKSLSRVLDKHVSVEVELNTARVAMESLNQEFRNLEDKRQIIDQEINKVRNKLEILRVESQGWKVKAETIHEQIKTTEFTLEDILKTLPQDISAEEWQAKLDQVTQRINRLGPINLVAIDEYATCLERKEYLDKQVEDLQAGLTTLEGAISKIDKETRARFKETFDKVNDRFQELFPTIFGGGKAYLELTSDNLLEAGVTMMACPPGKRNSSIYLLSGGEKSLTAIALIFSIFNLNPAPFCLLDEADAALDDANVQRFIRLVKVMAEKIQFIFISHNKLAIEAGEHLIGVTMNEPGVSRLVSVDIEKAITLAGS